MKRIYRQGRVFLSNGSEVVLGVGTNFTFYVAAGASFLVSGEDLTVESVESRTALTLSSPWLGQSGEFPYLITNPDISDLDKVRRSLKAQVNLMLFNKLKEGFVYQGSTFQIDEAKSLPRMQQQAAYLLAGNEVSEGFYWMDSYNNKVFMDKQLFLSFYASAFEYVQSLRCNAFALKQTLSVSDSPEMVELAFLGLCQT